MPTQPKKTPPAKSVAAYLAAAPKNLRPALRTLRRAIKAAAPKATETMSYRIVAFKQDGRLRL